MWLWLGVFLAAFAAEFAGDVFAVSYQQAVRKLWRKKAARWAGLLACLSWIDLSGIAVGWPLSALITGSVTGSIAGTYWAVTRSQIKARLRRKAKEAKGDGDKRVEPAVPVVGEDG